MDGLLTSLPLALGVIAYMLYQDWRDGKFARKAKEEDEQEDPMTVMQGDVRHLRLHYNDDLSKKLDEFGGTLKDIRDGVRDLSKDIQIMRTDGIPCKIKN